MPILLRLLFKLALFSSLLIGNPTPPVPYVMAAPCAVPLSNGQHADCMYLIVYEDREAHNGRTIKLPVVLFHSRALKPEPDPVVFTVGGPGNSTVRDVRSGSDFKSLDNRDLIIFEQRGSEYAQPHLACPEFNAADASSSDHNLTFEQAGKAQAAAAHLCYRRLSGAGVHLSAYNTSAIADDVADLRTALGLDKLDLLGLSYSTAIDLEVVRRHPEIVRSVVLDSVLPLDAHYDEVADANVLRSLHAIFDGCAVDPSCSRTYPNLTMAFRRLVERLNSRPVEVTLRGTAGTSIKYAMSGRNAVEAIYGVGLQSPELLPDVPWIVWQAYFYDYSPLLRWVQENIGAPQYSYGARLSVICHDWYPFERRL
jgi:pimeloyl-ACP methyl ester carboxylesterase